MLGYRRPWNVHLSLPISYGLLSTCRALSWLQMSSSRSSMFSEIPTCDLIADGHCLSGVQWNEFPSAVGPLVQAQFFPENVRNKRCELQFFSWRKTLISTRSFYWSFLYWTKPYKFVTYYGYCHSLDGATLFSKVDSNKLRCYVGDEIALICAKFGADLVSTSKVTRHNKVASRFGSPVCKCVGVVVVSADAVRVVFSSVAWLGSATQRCRRPHLSDRRLPVHAVTRQRTTTCCLLLTGQTSNITDQRVVKFSRLRMMPKIWWMRNSLTVPVQYSIRVKKERRSGFSFNVCCCF